MIRCSLAILILSTALAHADGKADAQPHVEAAMKAHADGKFDVALVELQAAYALDPQPDLLYAIGQVQQKLGNCKDAITSYEKFRTSLKDAESKKVTDQAIDACKKQIAAENPPPPPPPDPTKIEQPPPTTTPVGPQRTPFYKDVLGDALVGAGVVAGVVSIVMYVSARGSLDDAESAATLADYDDAVDTAHSRRAMAVGFGVVGAVLIGAGVVRWQIRPQPTAEGNGAVVSFGGRF